MKFETILEAIAYHAKNSPDKACLIEAETDRQCTYAELWRWACALSARLRGIGITKGDRVVVRVGGLLETYVTQFGVYLAGGVYCPVEQHMKEPRMIEMMKYMESSVLISTERISFDCAFIDLQTVIDTDAADTPEAELVFPDSRDLCVIVFSTGTTGKAKGIMRDHYSIAQTSVTMAANFGYTGNDIFLWVQAFDRPIFYSKIYAIFFVGGMTVHQSGIVFINDFFKTLEKYRVSVISLQSFAVAMLLGASPNGFSTCAQYLRTFVIGGGVLSEAYKKQLTELLPKTKLFIMYGATESHCITCYEFGKHLGKPSCAGKASDGHKVYLLDENGTELEHTSANNLGIIAVESGGNMLDYWKDPELTAKTLVNGRLIMTDMGYMDDDGYLYIMGRRDDVIVMGGYKVAPYEIEEVVSEIDGVLECVCVAYPDKIMVNIPKLFVKMKDGAEFSAKEILNYLSARLETFKLPRIIREIDKFPRVGNSQKIDRKVLRTYE